MEESAPLQIVGLDGKFVQFQFSHRTKEEAVFIVSLHAPWLTAESRMTTYIYGPPTKFFDEMATSWRGWEGEKAWAEIEGRVSLRATSDRLGHLALRVRLRPDPARFGQAEEVVELEAGQLDHLAEEVRRFFGSYAI